MPELTVSNSKTVRLSSPAPQVFLDREHDSHQTKWTDHDARSFFKVHTANIYFVVSSFPSFAASGSRLRAPRGASAISNNLCFRSLSGDLLAQSGVD